MNTFNKPFNKPINKSFIAKPVVPTTIENTDRITALFNTVDQGNIADVKKYILSSRISLSVKLEGESVLHRAIMIDDTKLPQNKKLEFIEYLVSNGAPVNISNNFDVTPLHLAIQKKYNNISEFLLKKGANVNALTNENLTPLHYSALINIEECPSEYKPQSLIPAPTIKTANVNEITNTILKSIMSDGRVEVNDKKLDYDLEGNATNLKTFNELIKDQFEKDMIPINNIVDNAFTIKKEDIIKNVNEKLKDNNTIISNLDIKNIIGDLAKTEINIIKQKFSVKPGIIDTIEDILKEEKNEFEDKLLDEQNKITRQLITGVNEALNNFIQHIIALKLTDYNDEIRDVLNNSIKELTNILEELDVEENVISEIFSKSFIKYYQNRDVKEFITEIIKNSYQLIDPPKQTSKKEPIQKNQIDTKKINEIRKYIDETKDNIDKEYLKKGKGTDYIHITYPMRANALAEGALQGEIAAEQIIPYPDNIFNYNYNFNFEDNNRAAAIASKTAGYTASKVIKNFGATLSEQAEIAGIAAANSWLYLGVDVNGDGIFPAIELMYKLEEIAVRNGINGADAELARKCSIGDDGAGGAYGNEGVRSLAGAGAVAGYADRFNLINNFYNDILGDIPECIYLKNMHYIINQIRIENYNIQNNEYAKNIRARFYLGLELFINILLIKSFKKFSTDLGFNIGPLNINDDQQIITVARNPNAAFIISLNNNMYFFGQIIIDASIKAANYINNTLREISALIVPNFALIQPVPAFIVNDLFNPMVYYHENCFKQRALKAGDAAANAAKEVGGSYDDIIKAAIMGTSSFYMISPHYKLFSVPIPAPPLPPNYQHDIHNTIKHHVQTTFESMMKAYNLVDSSNKEYYQRLARAYALSQISSLNADLNRSVLLTDRAKTAASNIMDKTINFYNVIATVDAEIKDFKLHATEMSGVVAGMIMRLCGESLKEQAFIAGVSAAKSVFMITEQARETARLTFILYSRVVTSIGNQGLAAALTQVTNIIAGLPDRIVETVSQTAVIALVTAGAVAAAGAGAAAAYVAIVGLPNINNINNINAALTLPIIAQIIIALPGGANAVQAVQNAINLDPGILAFGGAGAAQDVLEIARYLVAFATLTALVKLPGQKLVSVYLIDFIVAFGAAPGAASIAFAAIPGAEAAIGIALRELPGGITAANAVFTGFAAEDLINVGQVLLGNPIGSERVRTLVAPGANAHIRETENLQDIVSLKDPTYNAFINLYIQDNLRQKALNIHKIVTEPINKINNPFYTLNAALAGIFAYNNANSILPSERFNATAIGIVSGSRAVNKDYNLVLNVANVALIGSLAKYAVIFGDGSGSIDAPIGDLTEQIKAAATAACYVSVEISIVGGGINLAAQQPVIINQNIQNIFNAVHAIVPDNDKYKYCKEIASAVGLSVGLFNIDILMRRTHANNPINAAHAECINIVTQIYALNIFSKIKISKLLSRALDMGNAPGNVAPAVPQLYYQYVDCILAVSRLIYALKKDNNLDVTVKPIVVYSIYYAIVNNRMYGVPGVNNTNKTQQLINEAQIIINAIPQVVGAPPAGAVQQLNVPGIPGIVGAAGQIKILTNQTDMKNINNQLKEMYKHLDNFFYTICDVLSTIGILVDESIVNQVERAIYLTNLEVGYHINNNTRDPNLFHYINQIKNLLALFPRDRRQFKCYKTLNEYHSQLNGYIAGKVIDHNKGSKEAQAIAAGRAAGEKAGAFNVAAGNAAVTMDDGVTAKSIPRIEIGDNAAGNIDLNNGGQADQYVASIAAKEAATKITNDEVIINWIGIAAALNQPVAGIDPILQRTVDTIPRFIKNMDIVETALLIGKIAGLTKAIFENTRITLQVQQAVIQSNTYLDINNGTLEQKLKVVAEVASSIIASAGGDLLMQALVAGKYAAEVAVEGLAAGVLATQTVARSAAYNAASQIAGKDAGYIAGEIAFTLNAGGGANTIYNQANAIADINTNANNYNNKDVYKYLTVEQSKYAGRVSSLLFALDIIANNNLNVQTYNALVRVYNILTAAAPGAPLVPNPLDGANQVQPSAPNKEYIYSVVNTNAILNTLPENRFIQFQIKDKNDSFKNILKDNSFLLEYQIPLQLGIMHDKYQLIIKWYFSIIYQVLINLWNDGKFNIINDPNLLTIALIMYMIDNEINYEKIMNCYDQLSPEIFKSTGVINKHLISHVILLNTLNRDINNTLIKDNNKNLKIVDYTGDIKDYNIHDKLKKLFKDRNNGLFLTTLENVIDPTYDDTRKMTNIMIGYFKTQFLSSNNLREITRSYDNTGIFNDIILRNIKQYIYDKPQWLELHKEAQDNNSVIKSNKNNVTVGLMYYLAKVLEQLDIPTDEIIAKMKIMDGYENMSDDTYLQDICQIVIDYLYRKETNGISNNIPDIRNFPIRYDGLSFEQKIKKIIIFCIMNKEYQIGEFNTKMLNNTANFKDIMERNLIIENTTDIKTKINNMYSEIKSEHDITTPIRDFVNAIQIQSEFLINNLSEVDDESMKTFDDVYQQYNHMFTEVIEVIPETMSLQEWQYHFPDDIKENSTVNIKTDNNNIIFLSNLDQVLPPTLIHLNKLNRSLNNRIKFWTISSNITNINNFSVEPLKLVIYLANISQRNNVISTIIPETLLTNPVPDTLIGAIINNNASSFENLYNNETTNVNKYTNINTKIKLFKNLIKINNTNPHFQRKTQNINNINQLIFNLNNNNYNFDYYIKHAENNLNTNNINYEITLWHLIKYVCEQSQLVAGINFNINKVIINNNIGIILNLLNNQIDNNVDNMKRIDEILLNLPRDSINDAIDWGVEKLFNNPLNNPDGEPIIEEAIWREIMLDAIRGISFGRAKGFLDALNDKLGVSHNVLVYNITNYIVLYRNMFELAIIDILYKGFQQSDINTAYNNQFPIPANLAWANVFLDSKTELLYCLFVKPDRRAFIDEQLQSAGNTFDGAPVHAPPLPVISYGNIAPGVHIGPASGAVGLVMGVHILPGATHNVGLGPGLGGAHNFIRVGDSYVSAITVATARGAAGGPAPAPAQDPINLFTAAAAAAVVAGAPGGALAFYVENLLVQNIILFNAFSGPGPGGGAPPQNQQDRITMFLRIIGHFKYAPLNSAINNNLDTMNVMNTFFMNFIINNVINVGDPLIKYDDIFNGTPNNVVLQNNYCLEQTITQQQKGSFANDNNIKNIYVNNVNHLLGYVNYIFERPPTPIEINGISAAGGVAQQQPTYNKQFINPALDPNPLQALINLGYNHFIPQDFLKPLNIPENHGVPNFYDLSPNITDNTFQFLNENTDKFTNFVGNNQTGYVNPPIPPNPDTRLSTWLFNLHGYYDVEYYLDRPAPPALPAQGNYIKPNFLYNANGMPTIRDRRSITNVPQGLINLEQGLLVSIIKQISHEANKLFNQNLPTASTYNDEHIGIELKEYMSLYQAIMNVFYYFQLFSACPNIKLYDKLKNEITKFNTIFDNANTRYGINLNMDREYIKSVERCTDHIIEQKRIRTISIANVVYDNMRIFGKVYQDLQIADKTYELALQSQKISNISFNSLKVYNNSKKYITNSNTKYSKVHIPNMDKLQEIDSVKTSDMFQDNQTMTKYKDLKFKIKLSKSSAILNNNYIPELNHYSSDIIKQLELDFINQLNESNEEYNIDILLNDYNWSSLFLQSIENIKEINQLYSKDESNVSNLIK